MKDYRIGILGLGYVGLPLAVEFSKKFTTLGFDINSKQTVVGSNGFTANNPKFLKQSKEKLSHLQRQLARRKKGSNRWQKTKQRINKLHGKISRQRLDFAHQV